MRLIDADEVRLHKGFFEKVTNVPKFYEWLDSLPTVDAVPVVRCRDCKWWVKEGNDSFGYAMFCVHDCSLGGQGVKKSDDYCSYGERKEQNDAVD